MSKYLRKFAKEPGDSTDILDTMESKSIVSRMSACNTPSSENFSLLNRSTGSLCNGDEIEAKLSGWESKMWSAGSAIAARRLMTRYVQWRLHQEEELNRAYEHWLKVDSRAFE